MENLYCKEHFFKAWSTQLKTTFDIAFAQINFWNKISNFIFYGQCWEVKKTKCWPILAFQENQRSQFQLFLKIEEPPLDSLPSSHIFVLWGKK
jgi:hypothetical protein